MFGSCARHQAVAGRLLFAGSTRRRRRRLTVLRSPPSSSPPDARWWALPAVPRSRGRRNERGLLSSTENAMTDDPLDAPSCPHVTEAPPKAPSAGLHAVLASDFAQYGTDAVKALRLE